MGALEDYVRSQRKIKDRNDPMRDSVMSLPPVDPLAYYPEQDALEGSNPEDWVPNPKAIAAILAKAGAKLGGLGALGMVKFTPEEFTLAMKRFNAAKAKAKPTSYYEGFGTDELSGIKTEPEMFWGPGATKGKGKIETVPLSSLTPTQLELDTSYIPELLKSGIPGDSDILEAVRVGGKTYIQDGHHRFSALALAGKPNARIKVADVVGENPDNWRVIGDVTPTAKSKITGENFVSDLPGGAKLMVNRNGSYVKDPNTGRMAGNIWNSPEEAIAEYNKIKGYAEGGLVQYKECNCRK